MPGPRGEVAVDKRDRRHRDGVRPRAPAGDRVRHVAAVVGAIEARSVPTVGERHVQLEVGVLRAVRDAARGSGALRRARRIEVLLEHRAIPGGDPHALRAHGLRVSGDHAQSGRERTYGRSREPAVVDRGGARRDGVPVEVERRCPVRGRVACRRTRRVCAAERAQRREGVRRDVADERVVVRETRRPRIDDRIIGSPMSEAAEADKGCCLGGFRSRGPSGCLPGECRTRRESGERDDPRGSASRR